MDFYVYLFGSLCIVVYAWGRFNTPATWRSTTTSWQYTLALASYLVATLALWFVLTRLVSTNPELVGFLAFGSPTPADAGVAETLSTLSELSAPLLAALFMTTLLPRLPILARVDAALQRTFRELGAIPRKARQLSTMLRRAAFTVPREDCGEITRRLEAQGLDAARLLQSPRGSLEADWVRIVALMAKLEDAVDLPDDHVNDDATDERRPAARNDFLRHREVEYLAARVAYRQQAAIAAVLLKARLAAVDDQLTQQLLNGTDATDLSMHSLRQSFEDGCKRLLKELTHLISCGMLQSNFSLAAVCRELKTWGFGELAPEQHGLSVNDLIGIMLSITLYLFVLFLFVHGGSGKLEQIPIFALSIGLSMTAAVASAIYAKRLPIAGTAGRKFAVYFLAASFAAGCWVVIHYVRIMLTTGDNFEAVLARLWPLSPFAIVPCAAAFTLSWMTDVRPESWSIAERGWRWMEGLVLAVVLAGAASVAYIYVQVLRPPDLARTPPPVHVIVLVQAGLGFLIGVLVPHLCRRTTIEAAVERRPAEYDPAFPTNTALAQSAE